MWPNCVLVLLLLLLLLLLALWLVLPYPRPPQVVYILDQVRALEQEMRRRLEEQGLPDIQPHIMVVTRLIPQVPAGTGRFMRGVNVQLAQPTVSLWQLSLGLGLGITLSVDGVG